MKNINFGDRLTSIEQMKKNKFIDWGAGEPCPFCGKEFEKVDYVHIEKEHKDLMMEILF